MNNLTEKNYKKLYFKYKTKYLNLKKQLGGNTDDEVITNLRSSMIRKRFPAGRYTVRVKKLNPTQDNINKICHHYSMFSLIDGLPISDAECCSMAGSYYSNAIQTGNVRALIPERDGFVPINTTVRLLDFYPTKPNKRATLFPHSARQIGDLVWHKFNGNDFIFAIDSPDDRIKNFYDYSTVRTINVQTWQVPSNVFAGGVEREQIFEIII